LEFKARHLDEGDMSGFCFNWGYYGGREYFKLAIEFQIMLVVAIYMHYIIYMLTKQKIKNSLFNSIFSERGYSSIMLAGRGG
jgi:hypothetical protein